MRPCCYPRRSKLSPADHPPSRSSCRHSCGGETEKGIAIRLGKGRRTVNRQVASIYRACGVNSRMELLNRLPTHGAVDRTLTSVAIAATA